MAFDFYFLGKIFLISYVWILILFCIIFLIKSGTLHKKLKYYESFFNQARRGTVRKFIPVLLELREKNKTFQLFLGENKSSLKDLLFLVISPLTRGFGLIPGMKFGFYLTRKVLRHTR